MTGAWTSHGASTLADTVLHPDPGWQADKGPHGRLSARCAGLQRPTAARCPVAGTLQRLELGWVPSMTGKQLTKLRQGLTALTQLSMAGARLSTASWAAPSGRSCTGLQSLSFARSALPRSPGSACRLLWQPCTCAPVRAGLASPAVT